MLGPSFATLLALLASLVAAQLPPTPSSWPQDYPGKPSGDFSPEWQSYYQVTDSLPNVTWTLPRSFAGNIPVNRPDHPNNTLFFWAFENENGSLTADADERSGVPWAIWLNGGPGSSSLLGQAYENGPIHLTPEGLPVQNAFSWDKVADYIWIDQPVGVGWATAESDGYVHDEDEMGSDFMGFLENLVKVFPSLATRPLYLTGESYAGTYIPYIMKTYFGMTNPPVNIAKFAIGDGTLGSTLTFEYIPTLTTIETYPQLIGYDPDVYNYFREQQHLCGYDFNLTYPQRGHFPTPQVVNPTDPKSPLITSNFFNSAKRQFFKKNLARLALEAETLRKRDGHDGPRHGRRDLSQRAQGTIDPWYGCFIYDELIDYALNFSAPWNITHGFDVYQVQDALNPESPIDGRTFYNDPSMVAALHAPTSKQWVPSIQYPFLGDPVNGEDPSVESMAFLTDLATNATAKRIAVTLFSGNDDSLVAHRGTEVVIQNTTFGGTQGFSRRPSTPWIDDNGLIGGVVHQERNWSYVLVEGAGHLISYHNPPRGMTLVREFIIGHNATGLVITGADGDISVDGGELSALAVDAIPGQSGILVGSIVTTATFNYPTATVADWQAFITTATLATILPSLELINAQANTNGNGAMSVAGGAVGVVACVAAFAVSLFASV